MSYEAVLMDMDGVLIDTQESIIAFWQRLASDHHIHLSQNDIDQHISGRSANHTITTLLSHLDEQERQVAYQALHDYEASLHYQEVSGAIALLKELKRYHIPVALVTGAGRWKADIVVQQLGLEPFVTAQVTSDDIQRSKPAPDSFLLAAHRLGKQPLSCIVFEDAVNGVLAARAARTICIGVQTTAPVCALMAAGACCTIPDFTSVRVQATSSATDEADILLHIGADFSLPLKSSFKTGDKIRMSMGVENCVGRLLGTIQHYSWGGHDFIPKLIGLPAESGMPYAEYWLGAHDTASSRMLQSDGATRALNDVIREQPTRTLGSYVAKRYGL